MEITLYGRIPSKKNSKRLGVRHGRITVRSSENHEVWHEEQSYALLKYRIAKPLEKVTVHMTIYAPDRLKGDLTNKAESIMDLLVDNGFLTDDNWFVAHELLLRFGGVDTENPRAEITLYEN